MNECNNGCLFSPIDLRDFRVSSNITLELPEEFKLNYSKIKDQGIVNSCVAHALSSILENKLGNDFSTGWIYGYRPDNYYQGSGMYPREALSTLLNKGAVYNEDFDYNIEIPEAKEKVERNLFKLEALAEDVKISGYVRMNTVEEIKYWLYREKIPVLIAIQTINLKVYQNNIIEIPKVYPNSGHALMVVGWNETGFIVQNSWGTNFGKDGIAILPYEYNIKEAWGITISENSKNFAISKPKLFTIRKILQFIINFYRR